MLSDATITAFIATTNPARAKGFYNDMLGLRLVSDDQVGIAFDCNGIELRIQKVAQVLPHPFTALGWRVPDIREAVLGLVTRGVTFERYSCLRQDGHGVWQAPSGARVAWFTDPDGNLLSLTERGAA